MNPHQQNKIDLNKLTPDEQRLLRLYGKLPTKKDLLQNKLKERKYFDSGDYALSKAGKASDVGVTTVGSRHPVPENIPHAAANATSPPTVSTSPVAPGSAAAAAAAAAAYPATAHSPMKESSVLNHQTSSDDIKEDDRKQQHNEEESTSEAATAQQQS